MFGRVYRLNCDCSQVLFGDTEAEFYLEKTNCKLEGHPFSLKVCFHSPVLLIPPFYVLNKIKLLIVFLNQFRVKHAERYKRNNKEMVCVEYSCLSLRRVAEDITLERIAVLLQETDINYVNQSLSSLA